MVFCLLQRKEQTPDEVTEMRGSSVAESDTVTAETSTGSKGHGVWAPASHHKRMDPINTAITMKGLAEIREHQTNEVREAFGQKGDTFLFLFLENTQIVV